MPFRAYVLTRVAVGKPSPITVVSPVDIEVVDEEATEALRQKLKSTSPVVYRLDTSWVKRAYDSISRVFFILRGIVARGDLSEQRLREILNSELGVELGSQDLKLLIESRFSFDIEAFIVDALKKISSYYILDRPTDRAIIVYDPLMGKYVSPEVDRIVSDKEALKRLIRKIVVEIFPLDKDRYVPAVVDLLYGVVKPTLYYDASLTRKYVEERISSVEPVRIVVKKGELIVSEGQKVTKEIYKKLKILADVMDIQPMWRSFLGLFLFVLIAALVFSSLWFRVYSYNRVDPVASHRLMLFIALESLFFIRLSIWIMGRAFAPYAQMGKLFLGFSSPLFLPGLLSAFIFGFPLALIPVLIAGILICFLPSGFSYLPFVLVLSSVVAGGGVRMGRGANAFLKGIVWGVIFLFLMMLAAFVYEIELSLANFVAPFLAGVGVLFVSFASLPLFERAFGVVTDMSLLELANLDHPLLKMLLDKAPGTYNHSMYVGILAESAAKEVDANPILAKVGGYFHDIGKLKNPKYFTENTMGLSLHTKLSPNMSRLIIISHVKDGVELAKKYGLPRCVIDIIEQHHGTSLISYFYHKAKKFEGYVDESLYRYPGPKPRTKEAAIVMLADCVEAATRSLDDPTPSKIKNLVSSIVNNIFMDGQLDECDLTFKDVKRIREVFVKMLISFYHKRVKYPGQEEKDGSDNPKSNGQKD